jgi:hypothetical protein
MDEKKILLVNLSKGRLGDINANLIGLGFSWQDSNGGSFSGGYVW